MKIQILISKNSWANTYKKNIKKKLIKFTKNIKFINNHTKLKPNTDINIIFSYFKKIPKKYLLYSKNNLIPHESKLPKGKGMSPLTWQILENKDRIFFSLIEASDKIDSGVIYFNKKIIIKKTLLFEEIKKIQLNENLKLIEKFIRSFKKNKVKGFKQFGKSSFYRKRTPNDSELNINVSIKKQFNLLRVCDNKNFPSFFKINGKKYKIFISKL